MISHVGDSRLGRHILEPDVCVVGTGAAGLTLARQLDRTSLRVLLVEAGGLARDLDLEDEAHGIEHLGEPPRNPIPSRGRLFGGSTSLWYGRIATPDPIDLVERNWVPHSGWPLTVDELQPWLRVAADVLDVPRADLLDVDRWDPEHPTIRMISDAGARAGVFLWASGWNLRDTLRAQLERSTNVDVLLGATATELVPEPDGSRIDRLRLVTDHGTLDVNAGCFVLAAGGIENPRLLLASTARDRRGLGNHSDNVGRFYMDHPRGEGLAEIDLRGATAKQLRQLEFLGERRDATFGTSQLRVAFDEAQQREERLLNHALHGHLVAEIHETPAFHALKRIADVARSHSGPFRRVGGAIARDALAVVRSTPAFAHHAVCKAAGYERHARFIVIDQMEQEPDPDSRLQVDHDRRDRFGLPRVRLDWRIADSTYRSQRRMHELFAEMVASIGIRTFRSSVIEQPARRPELWDMKHPAGTTRMSVDPADGVVDPELRVHGVENLYVVGASTFPTTGHFNPTLTVVALAARLAERLARNDAVAVATAV